MGRIYSHTANTFVSDQAFINDVGAVIRDQLAWNGSTVTPNNVSDIIFLKEPNHGIKVDPANSSFTWADLLGHITVETGAASNKPTYTTYRNGIKQYQFITNDQVWVEYHIPHDYVPNTQIFVHTHWSLAAGSVTGNVVWGFEATYSKGHNQAEFPVTITTTVTENVNATAYRHMVTETPLSGIGLLDQTLLEPDGIILLRAYLAQNNTSPVTNPFLHFCDLHMQSTGIGTKSKSPNFYV